MRGSDDLRAKKAINVVKYATAANMVPVVVEDIHTKEKTEYKSVREAALALGIHNTTLSYALRNNSIFKKMGPYNLNSCKKNFKLWAIEFPDPPIYIWGDGLGNRP